MSATLLPSTEIPTIDWPQMRVHGTPAQLDELLQRLEESLPPEWTRDRATEEGLRNIGLRRANGGLFLRRDEEGKPALHMWVERPTPELLAGDWVSRLQRQSDELVELWTHEFAVHLFEPCVQALGLTVEYLPRPDPFEASASYWVLPDLKALLQQLPTETTTLTLAQRRQWYVFVVALHIAQRRADSQQMETHLLVDWLQRQGYSETLATEIYDLIEDNFDLLREYDRVRL